MTAIKLPDGRTVEVSECIPYYRLSCELEFKYGQYQARAELVLPPNENIVSCILHGIKPAYKYDGLADADHWDDAVCHLHYREPTALKRFRQVFGELRLSVQHEDILLGPLWALAAHGTFPNYSVLSLFDRESRQLSGFDLVVTRPKPWPYGSPNHGSVRLRMAVAATISRDLAATPIRETA